MEPKVGMLVTHPKCPEWGTGKVLLVEGQKAWVYFVNAAETKAGDAIKALNLGYVQLHPASSQSDPWLDRLPSLVRNGKIHPLPRPRLTFVQAVEMFMMRYPAGFADPKYLEEERNYKLDAHVALRKLGLGGQEPITTTEETHPQVAATFAEQLRHGLRRLNLLALFETLAFRDGLRSDPGAALAYRDAAYAVCTAPGPERPSFEALIEAVQALPATAHRVASWPVLTLVPFIARPDCHMLLKPHMTQLSADRLAFDIGYSSDLNWSTYERLLEMSRILLERLRSHGAADFIDVQSFMWVTTGDKSGT